MSKTKKTDLKWIDEAFAVAMRPRKVSKADKYLVKLLAGYLAKLNGDSARAIADYLYNIVGYYHFIELVEIVGDWSKCKGKEVGVNAKGRDTQ
jgi:hypothetical protein